MKSYAFGDVADQIASRIGVGYHIVSCVFFLMSAALWAYTYNIWRISRKNPMVVPFHRVAFAAMLSVLCTAVAVMERPGTPVSIKPVPIVKPKNLDQNTKATEPYKKKHWSNKKSTKNDN